MPLGPSRSPATRGHHFLAWFCLVASLAALLIPAANAAPPPTRGQALAATILADLSEKAPEWAARATQEHGPGLRDLHPYLDRVILSEDELARRIVQRLQEASRGERGPNATMLADVGSWAAREALGENPQVDESSNAAAPGGSYFPESTFYDFHPACDATGDGRLEMAANKWEYDWGNILEGTWGQMEVTVISLDGQDGRPRWGAGLGGYMPFMIPPPFTSDSDGSDFYFSPYRPGMPNPQYDLAPHPTFSIADDVTGDGVCEFIGYGYEAYFPLTPLTVLLGFWWSEYAGNIQMLDSTTGDPVWMIPFKSVARSVFPPPIPCAFVPCPRYEEYIFENYPTGFEYLANATDPAFVWKTTTVSFQRQQDAQERAVIENVTLFDAKSGAPFWNRILPKPDTGVVTNTWVSGAGQMRDDGAPEIVLDDGTLFAAGTVEALQGAHQGGGATVWGPTGFFTPPPRGQGALLNEDDIEVFYWQYADVVGDVTQDDATEVIASYFTGPPSGKFPVSEDFRTHFAPVSGEDGGLLWQGKDVKFQGWGFMQDLNVDASQPVLGLGTVDFPTPQLSGSRFPPKFTRLSVVDAQMGEPRFVYKERYGLDSYFSYELGLRQIQTALAPADVDKDGLRDLVTAGRFNAPEGAVQVLLSTSEHEYNVLAANDGKTLQTLTGYGPSGILLDCAGQPDHQLTIISGSARRLDVTRFNVSDAATAYRQPIYNNPQARSPTAGQELIFSAGRCADGPDNVTIFGFSNGLNSIGRGFEIMALRGAIQDNDTLLWVLPELRGKPPVEASLDFIIRPKEVVSLGEKLAFTFAPALPGIGLGLGLSRFRRKGGVV